MTEAMKPAVKQRVRILGDGSVSRVELDGVELPGVRSIFWKNENEGDTGVATVELTGVGIDSIAIPVVKAAARTRVSVHELTLDRRTRVVTMDGHELELANMNFNLLTALVDEPSRVFTKDELLRDVWGFQSQGHTRTLDSHASRLRVLLRKHSPRPWITNVRGIGYRLIAEESE